MALFNCPECRKEISDKAVSCPNCGVPINSKVKINKPYKYKWYEYEPISPSVKHNKFTCPNCKSSSTTCKRDIGCAVLIIIFISFGIGLIMIPFLPYTCKCKSCDYKWKS